LISLHRSSLGFLFSLFVSPDAPDKEQNKKPRTKNQEQKNRNIMQPTNAITHLLYVLLRFFFFLLFSFAQWVEEAH